MKHNWTELAIEAGETAADYYDSGLAASAAEWHDITMRRAAIAQAVALASIAESLAKLASVVSNYEEAAIRVR